MNVRMSLLALPLLGLAGTGSAAAADDAFGKDLKATIALQGLPCDQVMNSSRNKDSDYNVSCKDGNRYHVFVDASGRVVVQKL
jgi:hypothetical protein